MKPFEDTQSELLKTALDDPVILSGGFWDELRVFLAVAKLKSFAKAGGYLGLSTPTVSRHVRRRQDQLRSQLVVAGNKGAKLTADGASLARALAELDYKVFSIASNFRSSSREAEGVVRVSATEGLAGVFVAARLRELHAQHPGIVVHLMTPINVESLRENRVDIMIGFDDVAGKDLLCKPCGFLHLIPVASASYLRSHGMPTETNLDRHIFVDSMYYRGRTGLWDEWRRIVVQGTIAADCDSSLAHAMAIIGGLGIGLLGNYVLSDETLQPVDIPIHVSVPLYLIALAERLDARPVRIVMEWLAETFGPGNPWFAPTLNFRSAEPTPFLRAMRALQATQPDVER
jgi:DNA-binding transcriptional LysR family regulator